MNMPFPPRVALARLPTPIELLDRLSHAWGGPRIWIKRDDLTGSALSGNKVRKLEFSFGEAIALGAERVLTCGGIQSNHCRATAVAAARLGLECVVHLRLDGDPPPPDGNHLLGRMVGAEVRFVTRDEYAELGPTDEGFWIPEGASDAVGCWGYAAACQELLDRSFAGIWHATGSGGTTAGLLLGATLFDMETPIVGVCVCDDPAFFHEKIDRILGDVRARWKRVPAIGPSRECIEIVDGFQGLGYAINRPEEWETIRQVAQLEGVLLDPVYSGKAMHALRSAIADGRYGPNEDVLFLHTGGIYGLFPKRDEALG
jgi:D-cysteine desulfhydrase